MLFIFGPLEKKEKFDGKLNSIIIIAQEKLGDAILLTPLLRNLKQALPAIEIHILALSDTVYDFFEIDSHVDVVLRVKHNYFSYFKMIRKIKYDLLFSTKDHASFSFLCHSRIIRARHRVGIDHPFHKGFFNYLIEVGFHQHIIEKNCSLLDYIGVPYKKDDCRPYLPVGEVVGDIKTFVSEISNKNLIAINLSAGEKDREWSLSKWIELIEQIKHKIIIFAMPPQYKSKHKLEEMFDHVIKSPNTKSIYDVGEIIKHLSLLVSPDTSLIHIATCCGTCVVGLYRADEDHVSRFYPFLVPNKCVISSTYRIEDIPVERVADAVKDVLNG